MGQAFVAGLGIRLDRDEWIPGLGRQGVLAAADQLSSRALIVLELLEFGQAGGHSLLQAGSSLLLLCDSVSQLGIHLLDEFVSVDQVGRHGLCGQPLLADDLPYFHDYHFPIRSSEISSRLWISLCLIIPSSFLRSSSSESRACLLAHCYIFRCRISFLTLS
jgi:hypothetical protein